MTSKVDIFDRNIEKILTDVENVLILNGPSREIDDKTNATLSEVYEKFNQLVKKINSPYRKCTVFGTVSSGKSTFINCLLRERLLPSGNGSVTNTFIQIQKCEEGSEGYCELDGERRGFDQIRSFNEQSKKNKNKIKFFFKPNLSLASFPDNLIINDTPGIDFDQELDETVKQQVDDSDIIILILDSIRALKPTEKENIKKLRTKSIISDVFIIFNLVDANREKYVEKLMKVSKQDAITFLVEELEIPIKIAQKRVYFISAKNNLLYIETNNIHLKLWKRGFKKMKETLMNEFTISSTEKQNTNKSRIMNKHNPKLETISKQIESLRMKHNDKLNLIDELKSKTSAEVKAEIKQKIVKEFKNSIISLGEKIIERLTNSNVNEKMTDVVKSVFGELIKNVKTILMDTIKNDILRGKEDNIMKLFENFHRVILSQVSKEKCKEIIDTCNDFKQKYSTVLIGGAIIGSIYLSFILAPKILALFGYKVITNMACSTAKGTCDIICGYIDSNRSQSENEIMSQLNSSFNDISFDTFIDNLKLGESDITKLETLVSDIQKEMEKL